MWTPNYWPWILDLESWRIEACLIAILNLWSWISWSFFVVGRTLYVDLLNLDPELLNLNLWSWTLATHFMLGDLESLILNFMEDIWWEDWSTLIAALLLCFSLLLLVFSAVCWPLLLLLLSLFLHDWITKFVVLVCFSFCTFSEWAKLSAFRRSSSPDCVCVGVYVLGLGLTYFLVLPPQFPVGNLIVRNSLLGTC